MGNMMYSKWQKYKGIYDPLFRHEVYLDVRGSLHVLINIAKRTDTTGYTGIATNPVMRDILKHGKSVCPICGLDGTLIAHRLHYRNAGHETLNDLELMCRTCHCLILWYKRNTLPAKATIV